MEASFGASATALAYRRSASSNLPALAVSVAWSASRRDSPGVTGCCAGAAQGSAISSRSRLRVLVITVFDMPSSGLLRIDPCEDPNRDRHGGRQSQQEPIERGVNDTHRVMPDNVGVVFGVHPGPASQLSQAERINQHSPEIRDRGPAARRMADRVAQRPIRCNEDKGQGPQIRTDALEIERMHSAPTPTCQKKPVSAQNLS